MAAKKKTAPKKKAAKKQESLNPEALLSNWNLLNKTLTDLKEGELLALLRAEQAGKRRVHMLNRIHARFTKVRSERERLEIMQGKDIAA